MSIASETLQATDINVRDAKYRTPLHVACINGHLNDMNMLIKRGADKNAEDEMGRTPLALATVFGRSQAVRLLLDTGADDPSLIRRAISRGDDTILQMLLESFTDRDTLKAEIRIGLIQAAERGQESTVRILLNASLAFDEPRYWKSIALLGASYYTTWKRNDTLVRLLLDQGADPNFEDSTPRVSEYLRAQTPLSLAAGSIDTVKLLVQHGAVVDFKDSNGRTPLQSIFITSETAEFLIASGAEVNNRDFRGRTPLHDAIELQLDVISSLLNKHAEVDAQDETGLTPLMVALANNDMLLSDQCASRVKRLLQAGASARIEDMRGYTALHYAVLNGYPSVCETLIEHSAQAADRDVIIRLAQLHRSLREFRKWRLSFPPESFTYEVQARHNHEAMSILDEIGPSRLQANNTFLNICLPYELGFPLVLRAFLEADVDIQGQWSEALIETFVDVGLPNHGLSEPLAIELVGILFDYGLPINTSVTPIGTALCSTADVSSQMAAFLLERGADVELGGKFGSPLMIAVARGRLCKDLEEIVNLFLDYKADINRACEFPVKTDNCGLDLQPPQGAFPAGMTALHMAAASMYTSASTVALLLGRGANLEAVTSSGETPLTLAVKCARVEMVEALLAQGTDTTDIISMAEKDRMPGVWVVKFREALHMVQEAHRKRITKD